MVYEVFPPVFTNNIFPRPHPTNRWNLWGIVVLNGCLYFDFTMFVCAEEVRRIKVSNWDFFFFPLNPPYFSIAICHIFTNSCFQSTGEDSPFLSYFRGALSCLPLKLQPLATDVASVHQLQPVLGAAAEFW